MSWRRAVPVLVMLIAIGRSALPQAGLLVPSSVGEPDESVLSLREMRVDAVVEQGYARVNVRQVFENHTGSVQEGTYRFRLPPAGTIGDFAVWDGLVRIPGVILEKRRARAIYRELTTRRIDPGLLQQGEEEDEAAPAGGGLFTVTVAPIGPHATKRVELQYQQEVPLVGGVSELRLGLAPLDARPPTAGSLTLRIELADTVALPVDDGFELERDGSTLRFAGRNVALDHDLVVRMEAAPRPPLRVTTFRNPAGQLPDGVALAPWERASEIPPERDGFFLVDLLMPAAADGAARAPEREPLSVAILFDVSLSHRFAGLERSYARLARILGSLSDRDRFVVVPFHHAPADDGLGMRVATAVESGAALEGLRLLPLEPGGDVVAAIDRAVLLLDADGPTARGRGRDGRRVVLLTDGQWEGRSRELLDVLAGLPLLVAASGETVSSGLSGAARVVLAPMATTLDEDLFVRRVTGDIAPDRASGDGAAGLQIGGADAGVHDVYPIMVQPPEAGTLSGWIGRYARAATGVLFSIAPADGGPHAVSADLPEADPSGRALPRRWARARVDDLLQRIETEGERGDWIEEIIDLSRRYKFVTPYTAFLAAPRALLRPRRIQPGDPVIRVTCDPDTVSVVAFLPFGLRLPLERRPATDEWVGRFIVPEGVADGRQRVRLVVRDARGIEVTEEKSIVIDGTAPTVMADPVSVARAGADLRLAVRTDRDVVVLRARIGDGPPTPLYWEGKSGRSVGTLRVPPDMRGPQRIVFSAMDAANNHGHAAVTVEVLP